MLKKARAAGADDLKLIKGIGKVLEDKLNGLGVFHFDQIAAWSDEEVNWVNDHLSFKGASSAKNGFRRLGSLPRRPKHDRHARRQRSHLHQHLRLPRLGA
jgi:NADH-quinone oxidoreductase subunit E